MSVVVRVSGISGLVQVCSWRCSRGFPPSRVAWSGGVCRGLLIFFFVVLVWLGVCSFFVKWLFGLCFIHVVCVLCVVVVDVFFWGVCIYIIIRYASFLLGFLL